MAQPDRAWRRHKARTLIAKIKEFRRNAAPHEEPHPARPHAAQKARVWWQTEQELREAF